MKIHRILFLFLGMSLLCSCTSEQPERNTTTRFRQRKKSAEFPKLKDYSLRLSLISARREFYAGEERAYMIFSLKNTGLKPLVLREWHTLEAANVNLYYRPADRKESDWKFSPGVPEGTRNLENRSALILNPGNNQAMIQVPVRFLKELKNPARQKHPYLLKAVLNLRSVSVESAPVEIYIK